MVIDMCDSVETTAIYSTVEKFSLIGQMESDCMRLQIEEPLWPLTVVAPCGCEFQYQDYGDFPSKTVCCDCGEHKIVEYMLH